MGLLFGRGVDGFGKRGKSTFHLEAIVVNMPSIIETVDDQSKLEPLFTEIKRIVDDDGIVTIEDAFSI